MLKKISILVRWLFGKGKAVLILTLIGLVFALCLLYASELVSQSNERLSTILANTGQAVLTASIVQLMIRTWLWKEAVDSFFERLEIKKAISSSGMNDFFWYDETPWGNLFADSKQVTIVAITARALLAGAHIGPVKDFLRRKNTEIEVILANLNDQQLMDSLDSKFNSSPGSRFASIRSSLESLHSISQETSSLDRISVRLTSNLPQYTLYKFDDLWLFVPYLTKPERAPERIPVFCFKEDGSVADKFLKFDLGFIKGDGSEEFSFSSLNNS